MELLSLLAFITRWLKESGSHCRQRLPCRGMPSFCCACTRRAGHDLLDLPLHSKRCVMPSKPGMR